MRDYPPLTGRYWACGRCLGGWEGSGGGIGRWHRPVRAWSHSVHDLLRHLQQVGFRGAPRFLGIDEAGREVLTYLAGETVGHAQPWPSWTHSDEALDDVGSWLHDYHLAVADYVPAANSVWREQRPWRPDLIVGHGDPALYNAVWNNTGLVGLVDWDNAGPASAEDDLARVAFSWTPLHAAAVVTREGFTAFATRRRRLERLLRAYSWQGTTADAIQRIDARVGEQVETMRAVAAAGDPTYQRMLDEGLDRLLESARAQLDSL